MGLRKAKRRAADCFYLQAKNPNGPYILDDYRVCLNWGKSYDGKHFYRTPCIDWMVHLDELVETTFFLDGNPSIWGLMVRKWFEHKGRISLDKLVEYIIQFNLYEEELDKHDRKWLNHQFRKEHDKERPDCECHSMPSPPQKPVLEDYTASEEDGCNIVDLTDHPQVEHLRAINWATLFQASKFEFPEKEAEDNEGPPGPDADQCDKNGPAVE